MKRLWKRLSLWLNIALKAIKRPFSKKLRPVCADCIFLTKIKKLAPSSDTVFDCCTHEQHREPVEGKPDTCHRFNEYPPNYAKCPYFKAK